ncbi:MAG: hypothetical protein LUI87_01670 [Lachnospiraceae bacterium]|nr:hypothetical protein [Lachnospiraceae bacterium]
MKQGRQTNQKAGRRWTKVLVFLACVVVFCTTYALILPAITMEVETVSEETAEAAGTGKSAEAAVSETAGTQTEASKTESAETTAEAAAETAAAAGGDASAGTAGTDTAAGDSTSADATDAGTADSTAGGTASAGTGTADSTAGGTTDVGTTDSGSTSAGTADTGTSDGGAAGTAGSSSADGAIAGLSDSGTAEGTSSGTSEDGSAVGSVEETSASASADDTGSSAQSTDTNTSLPEETAVIVIDDENAGETGAEGETAAGSETESETQSVTENESESDSETETETETETESESESETETHLYTYEDDNMLVEVSLPEDSSVPEDAVLTVTVITNEDDTYEDLAEQAESAVEGEIEEVYFYDISFFIVDDENGTEEYLPVSDEATVTLTYKEKTLAQEDSNASVSVLHYEEDAAEPVVLEEVELTGDGESELETLTFQTEGFSVYAVVTVVDSTTSEQVTVTDVSDLNGNSYVIVSRTGTYEMTSTEMTNGMVKGAFASTALEDLTQWTFTQSGSGYIISSGDSWLVMDSNGYLSLTTNSGDATEFTVSVVTESGYEGMITISAAPGGGTTYYINNWSNDDATQPFRGYNYADDHGNYLILYTVTTNTADDDEVLATDLNGKSYAIVNLNTSGREYALSSTAYSGGGLSGDAVSEVDGVTEGRTYVVGDELTLWTFESTGTDGVYNIYTTVNGEKQYLQITGTSRGSVYTSTTPMAITVTLGTGTFEGQVRLSTADGDLNWYGANPSAGDVFGGWYEYNNNDYMTLCEVKTTGTSLLLYDLNLGGGVSLDTASGSGWYAYSDTTSTWAASDTPAVTSTIQEVTGNGSETLYSILNEGDNGYCTYVSGQRLDVAKQLIADGKSPGKEFRFDGWKATVTDDSGAEVTYYFAEDATIKGTVTENGITYILIDDTDGVERKLPSETVLTGMWTEISDIVMFFVNYSGTVLDVEGDVTGRNSNEFTEIIAIGHVYFGSTRVGTDGTFATDSDEDIRAVFANTVDLTSEYVQLVIDYATIYDSSASNGYSYYNEAEGINPSELEAYLLTFIQQNSNVQIKISTSDNSNNPTIDNANATAENYSVRWYVLKEQNDGWHVDGVMVAKTVEMTLTKNFYGITETEVDAMLSDGTLQTETDANKNVTVTDTSTFWFPLKLNGQDYLNISAKSDSQYKYDGKQGDELSYQWVLHLVQDELYSLEEKNYSVSGYDVSTILTHTYSSNGSETTESATSTTTADLSQSVKGGASESLIFANFYTKPSTGALAVQKVNESGSNLSGAVFTLYSDAAMQYPVTTAQAASATATSDSFGVAYFYNLAEGTYYLKETTAPTGYVASTTTWKVVVSVSGTDVTVTLYESDDNGIYADETGYTGTASTTGTICYSYSSGGFIQYLEVENKKQPDTLEITKTFSGLTNAQMQAIYNASTSDNDYDPLTGTSTSGNYTIAPYYIELKDDENNTIKTLYLQDATSSTTYSYTWLLTEDDLSNEDLYQIWTAIENNYKYADYTDTTVAAQVNGTSQTVSVDLTSGTASVIADLSTVTAGGSNSITIENTYKNTFTLSLSKVDSVTGEALAGAEFKIYGPYSESTNTKDSITYTSNQTVYTLYYIDTITSGADGTATIDGLTLSNGANVFAYVLDESVAPAGYTASTGPIVIEVTVDDDDYSAGVYSVTMPNTKVTTLTAKKVWSTNASSTPDTPVTLVLYRQSSDGKVTETVGSITLDGTADDTGETAAWEALWEDLEVYDGTKTEDPAGSGTYTYGTWTYYLREETVNGYETTYSLDYTNANTAYTVAGTESLTVSDGNSGTVTVEAVEATMGISTLNTVTLRAVTVINSAVYELPKTGGTGEWPCYLAGALMAAVTLLIYKYIITLQNRKTKGETGK